MKWWNSVFFFLFALVLLGSCRASGPAKTAETTTAPIDSVYLARLGCYGFCPVYQLTIAKDGFVDYKGYKNVEYEGHYQGSTPQPEQLMKVASGIDWRFYPDELPLTVADLPTFILEVKTATWQKKIYSGSQPPEELVQFATLMDSYFKQSTIALIDTFDIR